MSRIIHLAYWLRARYDLFWAAADDWPRYWNYCDCGASNRSWTRLGTELFFWRHGLRHP